MNATSEKLKMVEDRRATAQPRPKRAGQRDAEAVTGDETMWQRYDWRELNLASTARTLRHWHD